MLFPAPAGPSIETIIVWDTDSSRSKNPGKDIDTASAPSTCTPSRETSPATAPRIAIRWSPAESMTPPRRARRHTPDGEAVAASAVMRTPSGRRASVTVSIRSVSFCRSSAAPRTALSPRAIEAASANSGSSSISVGTSSGSTSVATRSACSTSTSATGSPPDDERL